MLAALKQISNCQIGCGLELQSCCVFVSYYFITTSLPKIPETFLKPCFKWRDVYSSVLCYVKQRAVFITPQFRYDNNRKIDYYFGPACLFDCRINGDGHGKCVSTVRYWRPVSWGMYTVQNQPNSHHIRCSITYVSTNMTII